MLKSARFCKNSLSLFLGPTLSILVSCSALAIREREFASQYQNKVSPFYENMGRACQFSGAEGVLIRCRVFVNPTAKASVVVAGGYTEDMHKYAEAAYDLFAEGYSVFLFDHRGQGYSQRLLADPLVASIDDFENLVADLHNYVIQVVKKDATEPVFVLAHSMGGAVAAQDIENYPNDFKAAVLAAPMFQINLRGWPESVALFWLRVQAFFGRDDNLVDVLRDPAAYSFEENVVTHSRIRYETHRQILRAEPSLKIYGQTQRWVRKAIEGSRQARNDATSARVPILLFQAETDAYVISDGQNEFCKNARHCHVLQIPGSKHEILQESDKARDTAFAAMLEFFKEQMPDTK